MGLTHRGYYIMRAEPKERNQTYSFNKLETF